MGYVMLSEMLEKNMMFFMMTYPLHHIKTCRQFYSSFKKVEEKNSPSPKSYLSLSNSHHLSFMKKIREDFYLLFFVKSKVETETEKEIIFYSAICKVIILKCIVCQV